jgi:hypothetical protein
MNLISKKQLTKNLLLNHVCETCSFYQAVELVNFKKHCYYKKNKPKHNTCRKWEEISLHVKSLRKINKAINDVRKEIKELR